jgi:hypothetical protein
MPEFISGAVFAGLIALLLLEAFPGRQPMSAAVTVDAPPATTFDRSDVPAACREGGRPLHDGGGLTLAC